MCEEVLEIPIHAIYKREKRLVIANSKQLLLLLLICSCNWSCEQKQFVPWQRVSYWSCTKNTALPHIFFPLVLSSVPQAHLAFNDRGTHDIACVQRQQFLAIFQERISHFLYHWHERPYNCHESGLVCHDADHDEGLLGLLRLVRYLQIHVLCGTLQDQQASSVGEQRDFQTTPLTHLWGHCSCVAGFKTRFCFTRCSYTTLYQCRCPSWSIQQIANYLMEYKAW